MSKYRKHGATPCTAVTVTMSNEDRTRLDVIRERFHDPRIKACPSRSLMLSVLVDWAFKSELGPATTGGCRG